LGLALERRLPLDKPHQNYKKEEFNFMNKKYHEIKSKGGKAFGIAAVILAVLLAFSAVGYFTGGFKNWSMPKLPQDGKSAYEIAVNNGFVGTEAEWIASLSGTNGETPYVGANGNWHIGNKDTGVAARGKNGADGVDGQTPHIGANGNWYIGDRDTGVYSEERLEDAVYFSLRIENEQGYDPNSGLMNNSKIFFEYGPVAFKDYTLIFCDFTIIPSDKLLSPVQKQFVPNDPTAYWDMLECLYTFGQFTSSGVNTITGITLTYAGYDGSERTLHLPSVVFVTLTDGCFALA
jgi:hypothetical protein